MGTRTKLNGVFTHAGNPGESYLEVAQQMRQELLSPDGSDLKLIPSFLDLLVHLKRSGRSFTLCFRTFGEDLASVAEDLNRFCEGKHPLYPGVKMDGSDGQPD